MKETEFKALMHCGEYINPNLLEKGLYATNIPYLYPKETTIDLLFEIQKRRVDIRGVRFISDSYFNNLKSCILVDVVIKEKYEYK